MRFGIILLFGHVVNHGESWKSDNHSFFSLFRARKQDSHMTIGTHNFLLHTEKHSRACGGHIHFCETLHLWFHGTHLQPILVYHILLSVWCRAKFGWSGFSKLLYLDKLSSLCNLQFKNHQHHLYMLKYDDSILICDCLMPKINSYVVQKYDTLLYDYNLFLCGIF